MKQLFIFFIFWSISWNNFHLFGQSSSCGDFSITNISTDSLNPNAIQVSIFYAASSSSFTNYPYISALLDCHGDTVATGNMFVFGQFGQSTVSYPLTLNLSNPCEPLTAVFLNTDNFGVTDTCQLVYDGTTSIVNNGYKTYDIFPNPSPGDFTVKWTGDAEMDFELFNAMGQKVDVQRVENMHSFSFDLKHFESGFYLLKGSNSGGSFSKTVMIE